MRSQETKQQALLMRQQGFSVPQISRELSISERTIQRWTANIKAGSIPMTYNQSVYTKEDKAENRFRILYDRGQSTKQKCIHYLSTLHPTADKYSLQGILDGVVKRLEDRGEDFYFIPEHILSIESEQLDNLNIQWENIIAQLEVCCSNIPNADKYLGVDIATLKQTLSTNIKLTEKVKWNIPVSTGRLFVPVDTGEDLKDNEIPY